MHVKLYTRRRGDHNSRETMLPFAYGRPRWPDHAGGNLTEHGSPSCCRHWLGPAGSARSPQSGTHFGYLPLASRGEVATHQFLTGPSFVPLTLQTLTRDVQGWHCGLWLLVGNLMSSLHASEAKTAD